MFRNDDRYRVPPRVEQALAEACAALDDAHRRYREQAPKGEYFQRAAEQRVMRAKEAQHRALETWLWNYRAANRRADRDAA